MTNVFSCNDFDDVNFSGGSVPSGRGRPLRPKQQAERIGVKHSTFWKIVKTDPEYPAGFSLLDGSPPNLRFERDIEEWLANRANKK